MSESRRTNKAAYRNHTYSGPRGSRKRIQAALKRHHGESSRAAVWRKMQKTTQTRNNQQEEANKIAVQSQLSAHTDQNKPKLKTYARAKPKFRYEASSCTASTSTFEPMVELESVYLPEPDSVSDAYELPMEMISSDKLSLISGYRIVDLKHVLQWAFNMQKHSQSCEGSQIECVSEIQNGFHSILKFKCSMCEKLWQQDTEKGDTINTSFVWATMTAGSCYTQAAHITSLMDIPTMTGNTFRAIERILGNTWQNHLTEEIKKAGEQERSIAIEKGNILSDGTPYITVYVDGGWSKRSYGHNFNPSSGMACIIGKETKKCLFFGIKNKYCFTCQYYGQKRMEIKEHRCCKQFTGPFTAIESDIIVEGFQNSEEIHRLRYQNLIGDGDSSVFANLKKVSYGNEIKKIECKNYVIKNYTHALYKILANTKLPLCGRNILKRKLMKLTQIVRKIIVHKRGQPSSMAEDLQNGPHHVLGNHEKCKKYYCSLINSPSHENKNKEKNLVSILKSTAPQVWALIYAANERVVMKAKRLSNETTNIVENFMSGINKLNCGKRLSVRKGGHYQQCVHIAGLSQTAGYKWHETTRKKQTNQRPGQHLKKYIIQRNEKIRLYRETFKSKCLLIKKPKTSGPVDIDVVEVQKKFDKKLQEFQESAENIKNIENMTIGQHENDMYVTYRTDRLTASHFGKVCKRRDTTPCYNHVKDILYKSSSSMRDMVYGQQNKIVAKAMFTQQCDKIVRKSGLFIDEEFGFLAASPDGVVEEEKAVVEIKCFSSLARKSLNIETAALEIKNFAVQFDGQIFTMNKRHDYYYEVQGQLRITKMVKCYFVCFVSLQQPVTVVEVLRDDEFIKNMMPKLVAFYKDFILPEIILRRVGQNSICVDFTDMMATASSTSN